MPPCAGSKGSNTCSDPAWPNVNEFSEEPAMRDPRIEELARILTGYSTAVQPGACYDECDKGNQSAVHWDMVKLLAGDGTIALDGEPIQVDSRFVHPDLLELNPF
jgi:aminopeptidase